MKKFMTVLALALGLPLASAQMYLAEEGNNPQFEALLQQQKLGTCEAGTYGSLLDTDEDDMPYDLS
ncbi:MAG: hypothetical protein Q4C67_02085 [Deinococcus sp.]|nr:hypothetical protein [Deinococcus sp.]